MLPHLPATIRGSVKRGFQNNLLLFFVISSLTAMQFTAGAQTIRYVKAGGTGTGTSWATASGDLQAMINASSGGDQVLVFAGTYKPTTGTDRTISFAMKEGVAIYGGFTSTNQNSVSQRPAVTFSNPSASILSGDIGVVGNNSDNSHQVISNYENGLTATAMLDGFVVTGGMATAGFPYTYGGGIMNYQTSPTIRNCLFRDNQAFLGGAVYNFNSTSAIINCTFNGNSSNFGGAASFSRSNVQLYNCSFTGNSGGNGGAIYIRNCDPIITNCSFTGNATSAGSTIRIQDGGSPQLTNSIVWGNSGYQELSITGTGGFTVRYSDINQEGYEGQNGNIRQDPQFVDAATGDLRLKNNSPVLNKGSNAANSTPTDLDGKPRVFGGTIDMGAFELQQAPCMPPAITQHPANKTVCVGSDASFSVSATGTAPLNIEWQLSNDGGTSWSSMGNGSVSAFTTRANNVQMNGRKYRAVVTNSCGTVTSNAATLTVKSATKPVVTVTNNCGNATLSATATGSLLWSTGETTPSITVSSAGTYTVTQTVDGCTSEAGSGVAAPKTTPSAPVITVSNNCGSSTLSTAAAGNLLWSTGETTPSITVSSTGSYTVTQTVDGCTSSAGTATAAPKAFPEAPVITASGPTSFCIGGSVTLHAPEGFASYVWSNGETTQSINVTSGGYYSVSVGNENGCLTPAADAQLVVVYGKPPVPVIDASGATTFCEGGSVVLTAPLSSSYLWSNGATTQSITVTQSGAYSVVVGTNTGCNSPSSAPVTITVNAIPDKPVITASGATALCSGGSVVLSAPAGFASYAWSNGATTPSITVNQSGAYSVTVTTAGGCTSVVSDAVVLTANTPPVITVPAIAATLSEADKCGATVPFAATVDASPAAEVSYKIGDQAITSPYLFEVGTTMITATATNACGTHTKTFEVVVEDETLPVIADLPTITEACSVTVSPTNGTDNCAGTIIPTTTDPLTYTAQGTYTIHWTYDDGHGNVRIKEQTVIIKDETKPVPSAATLPDITGECAVNTIAKPTATDNCAGTITATTNDPLSYTEQGTYTITWTYADGNGNSSTQEQTVVIKDDSKPVPTMATLPDLIGCSVTVSTKPTATDNCTGTVTATTADPLSYTAAGTYTITWSYTDANGNTSIQTQKVTVTSIAKPTITVSGATTFCQGGSVTLSAPGGYAAYLWSNGAVTQSVTVNQSGNYSVTVSNGSSCLSPASDAVTVTVITDTQKPVLSCPAATTLCYAASETYTIAALQASDNCAVATITYTITGATSRSGSGANASGTFKPGTSTITWTVKDASGNVSTCQTRVVVNEKFSVSIPDGWALGSGCVMNTVYKGYLPASYILLTAKPVGGKAPYTYKWSNGATASFILVNPGSATTYTVTVKDAKGCSQTASKQVNVVDVRCGSNMDKVALCYKGKTICTSTKDVTAYLGKGAYLGACKVGTVTTMTAPASVKIAEEVGQGLQVTASPNPSRTYFILHIAGNAKDNVSVTVTDAIGRIVEQRRSISKGQSLRLGDAYRRGMYFARVMQGSQHVTVKLLKQSD